MELNNLSAKTPPMICQTGIKMCMCVHTRHPFLKKEETTPKLPKPPKGGAPDPCVMAMLCARLCASEREIAAVCILSGRVTSSSLQCSAADSSHSVSPSFLSGCRTQRLASPSSASSILSPPPPFPRMLQPCNPGPAYRQMLAPSPATLDAGRSDKAHRSVPI